MMFLCIHVAFWADPSNLIGLPLRYTQYFSFGTLSYFLQRTLSDSKLPFFQMVAVEERSKGVGGRARKKSGPAKTTKWVEEAEFQGFEELKTDIKAESNNTDEELSFPAWHTVEGSETSAATEKPEVAAQEMTEEATHETSVESIIEAASAVEDEEPPVEVRPVALSDNQEWLHKSLLSKWIRIYLNSLTFYQICISILNSPTI